MSNENLKLIVVATARRVFDSEHLDKVALLRYEAKRIVQEHKKMNWHEEHVYTMLMEQMVSEIDGRMIDFGMRPPRRRS